VLLKRISLFQSRSLLAADGLKESWPSLLRCNALAAVSYSPGRGSKKGIQLIDDKRRPIDDGAVHLASKTNHF
jgi:hypothetical protein